MSKVKRYGIDWSEQVTFEAEEGPLVYYTDYAALEAENARLRGEGLRPEVLVFAHMMEAQLKRNDSRGGWKGMKPGELHRRLADNQMDLGTYRALADWKAYGRTCADIANFAMMLADNAGALATPAPSNSPGIPDSSPAPVDSECGSCDYSIPGATCTCDRTLPAPLEDEKKADVCATDLWNGKGCYACWHERTGGEKGFYPHTDCAHAGEGEDAAR